VSAPLAEPAGASRAYARYALGALFVVYVVSYVDRQIMSVLLESIRKEVGASDSQMGLLTGVAFAVFHVIAGIPIARWSDRGTRRSIIALSMAAWSLMTAATALAQGYAHLLLARIGVGVGEAGGSAPSHSLVSDYFPPERRATALAVLTTGGSVGSMLGLWLGGWLGDLYGWRATFVIVGLPGIAVALLLRFTVREPPRGRFDAPRAAGPARRESLLEVQRYLWGFRSFRWMTLAATLHVFAGYGASVWNPTFLIRVHGMSQSEAGSWLALVSFSALAGVGWGFAADRLARRDQRWYMFAPALGSLCAFPFTCFYILSPEPGPALAALVASSLLGNAYTGATFAMAQGLARPHMRTLAAATLLFVMNLFGLGLGPFAVGVLSDLLSPRYGLLALRYSLLLITLPHLVAAAMNLAAARSLRQDLARSQRPELDPAAAHGSR
jgi:predicted MFS family arabinose efflux permease